MESSFLEIFTLIAILHCFILSVVILLSKFFKNANNNFLGYTLLIIAIVGLNNWFWDNGMSPAIINILDLFLWQFLYPVMYFLYFYKTSSLFPIKTTKLTILFTPFILLTLGNIIISFSTIFNLYNLPQIISDHIFEFYRFVSFLTIIFLIFMVVLSYKYTFVKNDDLKEKWLKYLWITLSLILLYGVVLELHRFIYLKRLPLTYLWAFISVFIYWLIYKGLYQFKLSNDQYEIRNILKNSISKTVHYENNESSHFQELLVLLKEKKIHHNPNLSRDTVAKQLGISSGYLTQIIKNNTSTSYSDFINMQRVKDVKDMIKNPLFDKYNLLSIGLECGFNSKTSFYTNFKKETGLTPKEYRNK